MTANTVPEIKYYDSQLQSQDNEQTHSQPLAKPTMRNKYMLSLPLNDNNNNIPASSSRPKLHTFRSSDTTRFPTLGKIENAILPSKSSKIIAESVTFSGESNNTNNIISNGKKLGSQSDARSINSVKSTKKKQRNKKHQSTPSEVFAKNLNEAVLDVDDSLDDGYVYNLYPSLLSPTFLSPYETSTNFKSGNDESYFSDHHQQKYRRPGLRSTVSELPARGVKSFYLDCMVMPPKFEKRSSYNNKSHHYSRYRFSSSGEEDEENTPLLYYSSSGRKVMKQQNSRKKTWCKWLTIVPILSTILLCSMLLFLANPLKGIEVLSVNNVLGTRKQLIFDLYVHAKNPNSWSVQISHSAFSVFAASHYVPTAHINTSDVYDINNVTEEVKFLPSAKQEYLGTVTRLVDPLIFSSANLLYISPKASNSTSQIQIKNPGETKGDTAGNERWSSLIRYPYELTIRGVLKYQIFPSAFNSKVYSARICKVVQVDPGSGEVKRLPLLEQSICEEF